LGFGGGRVMAWGEKFWWRGAAARSGSESSELPGLCVRSEGGRERSDEQKVVS